MITRMLKWGAAVALLLPAVMMLYAWFDPTIQTEIALSGSFDWGVPVMLAIWGFVIGCGAFLAFRALRAINRRFPD